MLTASKRFLIVLFDSSMAMMPLPGATMAWAMLSSCSILMMGLRTFASRPTPRPPCEGADYTAIRRRRRSFAKRAELNDLFDPDHLLVGLAAVAIELALRQHARAFGRAGRI